MIRALFFIWFAVIFLLACDETAKRDETEPGKIIFNSERETADISSISSVLVDSLPSDSAQITIITEKSAVFTLPDTAFIKTMIEKKGEEDFYSSSDDSLFQQNAAAEQLQKKGINIIYPKTRYLLFRGEDQSYYIDTQKNPKLPWISILFEPGKAPEIFDPAVAEDEYIQYFEID